MGAGVGDRWRVRRGLLGLVLWSAEVPTEQRHWQRGGGGGFSHKGLFDKRT